MRRKILIFLFVSVLILCSVLFKFSKSREYQFTGDIINMIHTEDKIAALTFDDGPSPEYTDIVLDILRRENVKATFYMVGREMESNPEEIKKIIRHGHDIGNHSYSHARMMMKSWTFVNNEIDQTNKIIRSSGYNKEITFRPPYCKKLFILPYLLKQKNIKTITWNLEPDSTDSISDNPDKMNSYVDSNIKPGSIILMHIWAKSGDRSREALKLIIRNLKMKGYRFVTVSELLEFRDRLP